ncbi:MAG: CDP-alcohol phosphatidyltransferase family protein [bacterium]|nr:CDP-alcohol phosphatidyltransferase family protein [bacterium]
MNAVVGRWLADYRRMLKGPELEEPFDVWVYRPLAFVIVKLLAPTRVTPDHITSFSLLPGLAAAACYWQGTPRAYLAGAVLLFATNVLDCVDGMLARVRGAGSATGYILDGLADYVIQTTLWIALLHGVAIREGDMWQTLAYGVPAGLVFAWWCARVDLLRGEWLARVHGRRRDPHVELESLRLEAARWREEGRRRFDRLLVAAFGVYVRLWYRAGKPTTESATRESVEAWMRRRRPVLRLAVLLGPSTHVTLIVISGLLGRPQWYLWAALVLGLTWGAVVLGLQAAREPAIRTRSA